MEFLRADLGSAEHSRPYGFAPVSGIASARAAGARAEVAGAQFNPYWQSRATKSQVESVRRAVSRLADEGALFTYRDHGLWAVSPVLPRVAMLFQLGFQQSPLAARVMDEISLALWRWGYYVNLHALHELGGRVSPKTYDLAIILDFDGTLPELAEVIEERTVAVLGRNRVLRVNGVPSQAEVASRLGGKPSQPPSGGPSSPISAAGRLGPP